MHIDLTLVFERSWRIGSGQAAGRHLDDLVRTDGHGLPFVPGSTLRGIVADAARTLAEALGIDHCERTLFRRGGAPLGKLCGVTRPGRCPLCVLTGSNHRSGAVLFEPARLVFDREDDRTAEPERRRRVAEAAAEVPGLLTRHRVRTSIHERTGRADEEHLFAQEESMAGLELSARLSIDPSCGDVTPQHLALLVGALRFVREMGGGRRRGFGSCRIRIDGADLRPAFLGWREAIEALAEVPGAGEGRPPAPLSVEAPRGPVAQRPRSTPPLLAVDAVVVGELALGSGPDSGNLVPGLPFVPGSTLRGALAARWRGDRSEAVFHRLFLSGHVRFGYLHPKSGQVAARPVPLSRYTCKQFPGSPPRGHGFVDLLLQPETTRCGVPGCGATLVPWERRFEGPGPEPPPERLAVSPHNRIDFDTQTVLEDALFAYETLPEGRRLRGYVRADSEEEMALLLEGLGLGLDEPFPLRVGRRKGALGYLDCTLTPYSGRKAGVGLFPDAPPVPQTWREGEALRVDLLTPVIVNDRYLRYRESLAPEDLGLPRRRFDGVFARGQAVSGWNSAHRLPKSDEIAVRAGSSFLLCRPTEGAEDELQALTEACSRGVGRRLTEGFGVVSVTAVDAGERPSEGRGEGS